MTSSIRLSFPALAAVMLSCGGVNPLGGGPGNTGGFSTVPTSECPTGQKWTAGNRDSTLMQPGLDCVACHTSSREGPRFTIAGTVYPDLNIADACAGVAGIEVVITDADGGVLTLTTNEAGNFQSQARVALPFTAKVVSANGERIMAGPQTVGSCNSCHTPTGNNSAPGRIMAP